MKLGPTRRRFLALCLPAAFAACGPKSASYLTIYGGKPVPSGALPATVAIAVSDSSGEARLLCSGVLIAPDVVLTGGHCLSEHGPDALATSPDHLTVYFGDGVEVSGLPSASAVRNVAATFVHPLFHAHPLGSADYGVLLLTSEASVPPVTMITALSDLIAARSSNAFTIAGFGSRNGGGLGVKYEADVNSVAFTPVEETFGGQGKDACSGDSGGPILSFLADARDTPRLMATISRGVHLACGDGVIGSLTSDAACWISSLPGVHLPNFDARTCDPVTRLYGRSELERAAFANLCGSPNAEPAQRETVEAVTLALQATSCQSAATTLATATELTLDGLMLRDLSPLALLPNLRRLSLKGNHLTDLSSLRFLPKLSELQIDGNNVRDFGALRSQLDHGLTLYGAKRQLWNYTSTPFLNLCRAVHYPDDTSPAAQLITMLLWKTSADDCRVANERLLSLTTLDLSNQRLVDLSPLADLGALVTLDLSHNPLANLAPLANLEHLRFLDLTATSVTSLAPLDKLVDRGLKIRWHQPYPH